MHTFVNLNPLKISCYDINAIKYSNGSNLWFETVSDPEIEDYNEVICFLKPLVLLAKQPIYFTIIKFTGSVPF